MTQIVLPGLFAITAKRYCYPETRDLVDVVRSVYERSYADAIFSGRTFAQVESFMNRYESYGSNPDIDLVVFYSDDEPIAQAWGWPLQRESMWWTGLTAEPEPDFVAEDGCRTFALSEIMVAHEWVGRGVAHALQDFLLSAREERRATLLVNPANELAYRAYERWGWRKYLSCSRSGPGLPRSM